MNTRSNDQYEDYLFIESAIYKYLSVEWISNLYLNVKTTCWALFPGLYLRLRGQGRTRGSKGQMSLCVVGPLLSIIGFYNKLRQLIPTLKRGEPYERVLMLLLPYLLSLR